MVGASRWRAAGTSAALAALILLGACTGGGPSATSTASNSPSAPEASAAPVSPGQSPYADPTQLLAVNLRDVVYPGFSVRLAGDPYECLAPQSDPQDGLTSLVPCSALVHARGDGLDDDWLASNGALLADGSLVDARDLARTSRTVLGRFLRVYYPKTTLHPVTLREGEADVTGAGGHAYERLVRIPVRENNLPTTSDTVELVLVLLPNGRAVGWWSVLPDDAPAADATAAQESRSTLAVQG